MNLYAAFFCKNCMRWTNQTKRNFVSEDKIETIRFIRSMSCKCPVCKKSRKIYNYTSNKVNILYEIFTDPKSCTEFIQKKNMERIK